MFKTVKVSVTAERNWGDVNLLSRVGLWLMLRKMCSLLQAFRRHDQDSWCRIFFDTTCDGCIACVTFFLHETCLLLVSLFYGKYYVTMFIREYVAFSYRYWGKFLFKMRRNCLKSCFFIENVGFVFLFLRFSNRFFLSVSFRYILYFFLGRQWLDGFCWFCDLLFFHSYEKT